MRFYGGTEGFWNKTSSCLTWSWSDEDTIHALMRHAFAR
jgi:hypothetical protein